MALLYVFPVGEYIQFNDQNEVYITSIHYTELSFGLDTNGNIQFSHRRDTAQLYPIQAAPFAEIVQQNGTPYSAADLESFVAAFTAALPTAASGGGSGGGEVSDYVEVIDNTTGLSPLTVNINTFDNISAVAITALVAGAGGAFSILTTSGIIPAIIYPLVTVNGIIDSYKVKAAHNKTVASFSYEVPIGGKVLQIVTA